jgi:hypothetical protein
MQVPIYRSTFRLRLHGLTSPPLSAYSFAPLAAEGPGSMPFAALEVPGDGPPRFVTRRYRDEGEVRVELRLVFPRGRRKTLSAREAFVEFASPGWWRARSTCEPGRPEAGHCDAACYRRLLVSNLWINA